MSDSDDDYVEYGNALEPIDEDAVPKKKPVSLEDQVVTDAQGRRRFHGAFTGGFSAGFFNTVGSLEGWTPSSFKSSRSERMGNKMQKPSDFMDDEDIGEYGIAPQVLRATDDFNHLKRNRERGPRISDGPIPGEPVLKLLLEPVRETVGLRMLRRMGWRPGQGVGPRVAPRMKKRLVGCTPPPDLRPAGNTPSNSTASSEDDDVAAEAGITFAPQDVPSFLVSPKTDKFGLGYRGLDRRPVLSSTGSAAAPRRVVLGGGRGGTVSVAGQAFGVGALEEDDEDIYALEDMSQYDFALGGPATSRPRVEQPSAAQAGSSLLETFTKAVRVSVREHFPPPTLPKDFAPVMKVRKTRFDQPPPGAPVAAAPARVRSVDERAALVGERGERSAPAGEEGGYAEKEDEVRERERLRAEALKLTASLAPPTPGDGAGAAGRFAPFAGHPDKQRRYEQFLALRRAGQPGKLSHLQPLSMTEWERQREIIEFEQAARLFQPLSADMGERFVSASQSDDSIDPMTPVEKTLGATPEQRSAAKMKMFGQMTRTREPWQPCDLLCKRFNIAKPTVSNVLKDSQNRKKVSVFDFLKAAPHNAVQSKPCQSTSASSPTIEVLNTSSKNTLLQDIEKPIVEEATSKAKVSVSMESSDTQQKKEHETTVAESKITEDFPFPEPAEKIDLFKAIFLSSSESESEQEEKEECDQYGTSSQKDKIPSAELSHLVASAPADVPALLPETQKRAIITMPAKSGVFANLDLDALLSQPTKKDEFSLSKSKDSEILKTNSESMASSQDDVYGPRLPSTLSVGSNKVRTLPSVVAPLQRSSPICEWVESKSSHKKKKKDKKHKDKKHKSSKHKKHKHKK